ncbi:MAG TPA: FkbM family methyltransferase [Polyangiaceae bacterium]|jgi:FkbM family methyltransferase
MVPGGVVVPFVGSTVLFVDPGMTGATGSVYVGLHEFADMAFVLHYLREPDLFVDVGANVGVYTVLASGFCRAESVAVEPVPKTFQRLLANVRLNDLERRVQSLNIGLARDRGTLAFTGSLDTVNHVVSEGEGVGGSTLRVPVMTLDEVLEGRAPSAIKMDVEGFETEVLAGAVATLGRPELRALIVELNGSGARYGFDESSLRQHIESFGFEPYQYEPFARTLREWDPSEAGGNVLYLRDVREVTERLRTAPMVRVLDREF